jgi:glycosyltransferase involved in cell wall biosynthesis
MKVSVQMITYNHEKYIAQAIESVLMQETDFAYELVIGEDCSPDGTREIVVDYARRFPAKIRALLPEQNLGMHENASRTRQACQGEYRAILEGDDYWTDPHKLQKQVDFLDSHPECAMCFHDVMVVYEDGSKDPHSFCPPDQKEISTIKDLLVRNFIPTCSVMVRKSLPNDRPDWYQNLPIGDLPSHILTAQHGDIGYIDDVMGAYRVHPGGIWSQRDPVGKLLGGIEVLEQINAHLSYQYEELIRERISVAWGGTAGEMIEHAVELGGAQAALAAVLSSFGEWSRSFPMPAAWKTRTLGRIYAGAFFASREIRAPAITWHCFFKASRYDPSWLRNRGVWSILLRASLGGRSAALSRPRSA